jgi:hypothetical protein
MASVRISRSYWAACPLLLEFLERTMPSQLNTAGQDAGQPPGPKPPGVISSLETYTVDEAKARLRWTDSALRAAKRRGLRLLACGKRRYVTGEEIRRFLESL